MKYVALSLLFLNLAFFVWAGFLRAPDSPPPQITRSYSSEVSSLELVSEVDTSRQEALNRVINNPFQIGAEPSERGSSRPLQCTALGPFSTVFDAEARVQQASALDIAAEMRAIDEATGDTDFRVLIPPAPSIEEAFRKLRELKSLGVDSYIITQGDQALGISLGVFSTQEAAETLRAQRERQGYQATIDELPQIARQFWVLDLAGEAEGSRLDAWRSLTGDDEGVFLASLPCPDATPDDQR